MSYEQSVIAEVQARYGVPVTGAVQIVPRGASGIFTETPVWNGLALVYPSQMGHGNGLRDALKRTRDSYARRQKFERGDRKAGRLNETDAKIAKLRGMGLTLRAIADEVGASTTMVHVHLSMMPKVTA